MQLVAIVFVVTRELIGKTFYERYYALEDFLKCPTKLNHSYCVV